MIYSFNQHELRISAMKAEKSTRALFTKLHKKNPKNLDSVFHHYHNEAVEQIE